MSAVRKIYTLADARAERVRNDYLMDVKWANRSIKDLTAKVAHWDAKVKAFNGEIQRMTHQRFVDELAAAKAWLVELTGGVQVKDGTIVELKAEDL